MSKEVRTFYPRLAVHGATRDGAETIPATN